MRRDQVTWLAGVVLGLFVAGASAAPPGLTAKVGTLGVGADATLRLTDKVNGRVGVNAFSFDHDVDIDNDTLQGSVDLLTIPILIDWHPKKQGFRISAGVVINDNEIGLSTEPGDTIELNGVEFQLGSLNGSITFDNVGYYVGIGTGNACGQDDRWHFSCDFGVMYHGEPDVNATAVAADEPLQSAVDSALAVEVDDLQDDLKSVVVYPVFSVGVSYSF